MSRQRRAIGKIDRLPPALKDTVDQMLMSGESYRDICGYLAANGEQLTQASVCRYAQRFLATANELRVAHENFRMLLTDIDRYPNLDPAEALLLLASQKVLDAITQIDADSWVDTSPEDVLKTATALARAAAYKRKTDTSVKTDAEKALDSNQTLLYEALKRDNPTLYNALLQAIKIKKEQLKGGA